MNRSITPGEPHSGVSAQASTSAQPFPFAHAVPPDGVRSSFLPAALTGLLSDFAAWARGRTRVTGWMNIYRSGYYHRAGKPNMYDRHPGDLYPTREAALAEINPAHLYVATVPVAWWEEYMPHVNAVNSVPVPVMSSRRTLAREAGEYVDGAWTPKSVLEEQRESSWPFLVLTESRLHPMI